MSSIETRTAAEHLAFSIETAPDAEILTANDVSSNETNSDGECFVRNDDISNETRSDAERLVLRNNDISNENEHKKVTEGEKCDDKNEIGHEVETETRNPNLRSEVACDVVQSHVGSDPLNVTGFESTSNENFLCKPGNDVSQNETAAVFFPDTANDQVTSQCYKTVFLCH